MKCTTLTYPRLAAGGNRPTELTLKVTGTGGFSFNDSTQIGLAYGTPEITFINTDKPVYKPGQLGKLILKITGNLVDS